MCKYIVGWSHVADGRKEGSSFGCAYVTTCVHQHHPGMLKAGMRRVRENERYSRELSRTIARNRVVGS